MVSFAQYSPETQISEVIFAEENLFIGSFLTVLPLYKLELMKHDPARKLV